MINNTGGRSIGGASNEGLRGTENSSGETSSKKVIEQGEKGTDSGKVASRPSEYLERANTRKAERKYAQESANHVKEKVGSQEELSSSPQKRQVGSDDKFFERFPFDQFPRRRVTDLDEISNASDDSIYDYRRYMDDSGDDGIYKVPTSLPSFVEKHVVYSDEDLPKEKIVGRSVWYDHMDEDEGSVSSVNQASGVAEADHIYENMNEVVPSSPPPLPERNEELMSKVAEKFRSSSGQSSKKTGQ